jgi:hypothetical protein
MRSIILLFAALFLAATPFDNNPQPIPFSQDWTVTNIFSDNDWSIVPGIVGYKGSTLTNATGADPQTILEAALPTDVQVYANRFDPNIFQQNGVAEFENGDRTIALQAGPDAPAPHIVLHLNTQGHQNILISYLLRDIDNSPDNAVQPVALQYRVGDVGNFTNISSGFVADATRQGAFTITTQVIAQLPAGALNKPWVQVRIITTNAAGNDEWVGIDNIVVSSSANAAPVVNSSPGVTNYIHQTAVVVDNAITVTDADNPTLFSAAITLSGEFFFGNDQLQFTADGSMGNIVGSYDFGQATLNLSSPGGTATLAQWQAALRAVRYVSNIIPQHPVRYVRFVVSDGTSPSNISYKTLHLTGPGQPLVTTSGGTTNYLAGTPVAIDNGITVSDPNSATLASATIQFSGAFQFPEDQLLFTNDGISMGNISGFFDPLNSKMTLSSAGNIATLAQWQAALRSVQFSTGGVVQTFNRNISFMVNDGTFQSAEAKKMVSVATSTPPVVASSPGVNTYVHLTPVIIDGAITVNDVDNSTLTSALVEFTNYNSGDQFQFTNDGSTMGNISGSIVAPNNTLMLTGAGSTLAQWQAALRSVKYVNTGLTPNATDRVIGFKVSDGGTYGNTALKTVSYMPLASVGFNFSTPIHTVDPNSGLDGPLSNSSLAMVNGKPSIAYHDYIRGSLIYARSADANGTSFPDRITLDSNGKVNQNIKLLILNGYPAILYGNALATELRLIKANDAEGNSWGSPISVPTGSSGAFSAEIVNGNPAIAYSTDAGMHYMRALNPEGTNWGTALLLNANGGGASLKVVNGNPAISFNGVSGIGNLSYMRANDANGSSWGTPKLLENRGEFATNAVYSSLQVIDGYPAIAYSIGVGSFVSSLKYRRASDADGNSWPVNGITVNATANPLQLSLRIINGNPAISYYANNVRNLQLARSSDAMGNTWSSIQLLDMLEYAGQTASFEIINGHAALSYSSRQNLTSNHSVIKYIRANDVAATSFSTAVALEVWEQLAETLSIDLVNGNPSLLYPGLFGKRLYYQRAVNSIGSEWADPLQLMSGKITGHDMEMVAGNPAIAYYDELNGDLKFVRANNSDGSQWGSHIVVDATGDVGNNPTMIIVNGNPAISYITTGGGVKFVRANDPLGNTWGAPLSFPNGTVPSLRIINGNPAMAYYDYSNQDLKYVRSNDASGSSWATPVTVDATGVVGLNPSLNEINGHPAIAYRSSTALKYVRATNMDGGAWGAPVSIDAIGESSAGPSLHLVGSRPVIAYHATATGQVKIIMGSESNGATFSAPLVLDNQVYGVVKMLTSGSFIAITYNKFNLPYYVKGSFGFNSAPAHHFRSRQTGTWKDPDSWESSPDNIHWYKATLSPDASAASITVRTGHTITITANVTIDNLVTESSSNIITNTGVQVIIL